MELWGGWPIIRRPFAFQILYLLTASKPDLLLRMASVIGKRVTKYGADADRTLTSAVGSLSAWAQGSSQVWTAATMPFANRRLSLSSPSSANRRQQKETDIDHAGRR